MSSNPTPPPAPQRKAAVLAIVIGSNDEPVYLKDFRPDSNPNPSLGGEIGANEYLYHFLLHSSLDMVSEKQWTTSNMFLGVVETFREFSVSAFVTISGVKLLLLHHGHSETNVKNFLREVQHLWLKQALNPLQDREARIVNPGFESRLQTVANKYLVF